MDTLIIQHSITLFEILCVIIVFASIFMRSRFFTEVYEQHPSLATQAILMVFFGILSIFGTLSGITIYGAVGNVRDLGPMAAGLLCGPWIGLGSGIIGGLFRFAQGGPYLWTGLSAPILSGVLGGVMYLANRRKFISTMEAVILIGLSETLISCYTLVIVTKPAEFYTVVTSVAIPMILFNIIGMFIFATVAHQILRERETQKAMHDLELEVESRRNLSAIINTIAYPVYVIDRDHRITLVNDSLCRFYRKRREEILGHTHRDFYLPADADGHWAWVEAMFQSHTPREEEVTITHPATGQSCTIISTATVYEDASGTPYIVGVVQDITERKKMQVTLAENEAWYRILFEHTGAATVIINNDGTIDQANTEFSRLAGYPREEIQGRMKWTLIAHPDDLAMVKQYHRARRADPAAAPSSYTVRIIDRAGDTKILHAVVAMIPGTDKSIASYVDISEKERIREALGQMNRKLNLLSSITRHDIINQLMILKGFLTLLRQKTADPMLRNYIDHSEKATASIEHQIIFTRDYQDMGVKAPSWQNLRRTVINAKGALNLDGVTFESSLPETEVFADPLFEKVFFNLIDNSLKYGGDAMKNISVSAEQDSSGGFVIVYRDNGAGIAAADRGHLFERGFGRHTGFGLFLSREILSITGITIDETGTEGQGARFTIHVPKGGFRPVPDG